MKPEYFLYIEIFCLVMATFLILLQNRGAGLSSTFGGSDEVYITRRGIEKTVTQLTVIFIAVFVVLRIVSLFY